MGDAKHSDVALSASSVIPWSVQDPVVNAQTWRNTAVQFRPGDVLTINAGGCVQTGGFGATWKRYLNPDPPDKYYGTVQFPGMAAPRPIREMNSTTYTVPPDYSGDLSLVLGYVDDDYSDNGYYDHDDGTGDQCKNIGNAWVSGSIIRGSRGPKL